MYALVLVVHVIVCFVLIAVVLLQAGRGGGFSEMLGGGQPQTLFGTQTNAFMLRATEVCAVLFILTSLTLGFMSTHKSRSLINESVIPAAAVTEAVDSVQTLAAEAPAAPAEVAAPVAAEVPAAVEQAVQEVKQEVAAAVPAEAQSN